MNELKILKGDPVEVRKGLYVHPLTLGDIANISDFVYYNYLRTFRIDKSLLNQVDDIPQTELNEIYRTSELETIYYFCSKDPSILYYLLESLEIFLKSKVSILKDKGIFIENNETSLILDNDLFLEIKDIVFKQNYLKNNDTSHFKPANARAKALLEKMKKVKEKIQNQNKEEGLSLKEIISIVATYSNDLNILSIWDLTVNQLYEAYLRLMLWDDYHNKFVLLPHTTDSQSLDLKHWAVDINKIK